MNRCRDGFRGLHVFAVVFAVLLVALPAFAGYNASAPKQARRIFTQLALVGGRAVSYHVLEPGPQSIQAFPTGEERGKLFRFPNCVGLLRPVLDDSALPSPDVNHLILDQAMREVVNVTLSSGCTIQPKSQADVSSLAASQNSIGFVNAPSVPGPVGDPDIPLAEQQSDDELWGPVPDPGVCDVFAGCNLWPQHLLGKTQNGNALSQFVQPNLRRPRIKAYTAGRAVYFITYETQGLAQAGLVDPAIEAQWSGSGFPGDKDLFFLAYGRAPLPPNGNFPPGSNDSTGFPNDNQAVLNVVGGAPFFNIGKYSPLWEMHCLDGGITPTIGPGAPCGNTRFHQVGQPRFVDEVNATGLPIVDGIFKDINCPIIATDVNDDGTFEPGELVRFANVAW